jgi:copper(I)-binding protein
MTYRSFIAAVCAATVLAVPASAGGIMAVDPYARAASPNAKAGAAFMMLKNDTGQDDTLIAARSDVAKRVELHTHLEVSDGVMQMTEIEGGIPLVAGATHNMMRGGDHIMLMGLTGPLHQDAEISVTLVFEQAGEVTVLIPVDNTRKPSGAGHGDHSN